MTDYNKLAKECLDKYPNRKINVFVNPNYVGSLNWLGEFDDVDSLAETLEEAKEIIVGDDYTLGMEWLDVFPVEYTPEEQAEIEQNQKEWRDHLFDDWG
jgi:hypothetical protein